MTNFLIYPEIDPEDYSFPPEVNQAIADAPEMVAKYRLRSESPDPGPGGTPIIIDGGSP